MDYLIQGPEITYICQYNKNETVAPVKIASYLSHKIFEVWKLKISWFRATTKADMLLLFWLLFNTITQSQAFNIVKMSNGFDTSKDIVMGILIIPCY